MSVTNGVVRIGKKGIKKFAFGDGPEFEVDAIAASNDWDEFSEQFWEVGPDGTKTLKSGKEYYTYLQQWVTQLNNGVPVSQMEAAEFLKEIRLYVESCADFFDIRRHKKQPSPGSSESTASASPPLNETSSSPASPELGPSRFSMAFETEPGS